MSALAAKLLIRFLVFALAFAFAARKHPKVSVQPKIALPLVALVFALLNTGLYWLLKPVLNLATLGGLSLLVPFVLNGAFLWATAKVLRPLRIEGLRPLVWLAVFFTIIHGVLYLVLERLL